MTTDVTVTPSSGDEVKGQPSIMRLSRSHTKFYELGGEPTSLLARSLFQVS